MASIYALLIGINHYPVKPLQGCINDVDAVENYLKTIYPDKGQLIIRRVTDNDNDKPVRETIIKSFEHFANAKDDDTCLFYYSGHGSFSPAPEEFWTDSSGFVQSLVCQDSRLPGGTDLMDKELSFLIWKTMIDKPNATFVAITDCCHSGTITKAIDNTGITDRMMTANSVPTEIKDYLGFGAVINNIPAYETLKDPLTNKNRITVAQGNHIHLAASRDNQTSKELTIEGKKRGAFTHSLLKTLYGCGGRISYKELVDKTTVLVKNLVPDQYPGINMNGTMKSGDRNRTFLSDKIITADSRYRIYYDGQYNQWCIQAGSLNAVYEGDIVNVQISLNPVKEIKTKILASPFPDFSFIENNKELKNGEEYYATVTNLPGKKLKISFAPDTPEDIKSMTREENEKIKSFLFSLLTEAEGPGQYIMRYNAEMKAYFLTLPGSMQPVFAPVNTLDGIGIFLEKIEVVSKWLNMLEFNNKASAFTDKDYKITLYRDKEAGDYTDGNFEELKNILPVNDIYYKKKGEEWQLPAFRVSITNTSNHSLWITGQYLEFDYAIKPEYFGFFEIGKGQTGWLKFKKKNGSVTDIIKMQLDKKYENLGYNDITEYLKLFISTDPIDLGYTEQKGLDLAIKTKSLADDSDEKAFAGKDWKTETIGIRIIKPIDKIPITAGSSISLGGINILPSKLIAKAGITGSDKTSAVYEYLSNAKEFDAKSADTIYSAGDDIKPPHKTNGNSYLEPFDLGIQGTRSGAVLDVLELSDVENPDAVTANDPLIIEPPSTRSAEDENILPIGYDPETGLYYPLGYYSEGKIYINTLPPETSSDSAITQKSFLGSIKIYFQKVIGAKLGFAYDYPQLAWPKVNDGLEVTYEKDLKIIGEKVKANTNIIVFIHGIIGDTAGMVTCIKTRLDDIGSTLEKKEDTLILSFDYENLNTSIKKTAEDLKDRLDKVGLAKGHGKNLILVVHSMGGLVSRWFTEKLGGHEIVSKLIMLGTPNNGSPWSDVRDMADALLTYAMNGASFLKPWMLVLSKVCGKLIMGVQVTLKEMDSVTGMYVGFNDTKAPEMPYSIIAGNTQKIIVNYEGTSSLIGRLLRRVKKHGVYDGLDLLLFKKPNDIAATDESIHNLSVVTSDWKKKPVIYEVPCDHLNYFVNKEALKLVWEELNDSSK